MMSSEGIAEKLNIIKSHPDPLSQAQLIVELKATTHIQNKHIAEALGMKPSNVSHLIRVTRLPEIVLDGYMSKQISFTHLILISRLKKHDEIVGLYEEILQKGYSALQTERRIREILYLVDTMGSYLNKDKIRSYENRISGSLGERVVTSIIQTRIKAKITIEMTGDLTKTSDFIDAFVTRFRSKRGTPVKLAPNLVAKDPVLGSFVKPDYPSPHGGESKSQSMLQTSLDTGDSLGLNDNAEGSDDIDDRKKVKYLFDPDF